MKEVTDRGRTEAVVPSTIRWLPDDTGRTVQTFTYITGDVSQHFIRHKFERFAVSI